MPASESNTIKQINPVPQEIRTGLLFICAFLSATLIFIWMLIASRQYYLAVICSIMFIVPAFWYAIKNFSIKQDIQLAFDSYPDEPWKWNPKWNNGYIKPERNAEEWYSILIGRGLILGAIFSLVKIRAIIQLFKDEPAATAFLTLIILLMSAAFSSFYLHYMKYQRQIGDIRLEIKNIPLRLGQLNECSLKTDEKFCFQDLKSISFELRKLYKNYDSNGLRKWDYFKQRSYEITADKPDDIQQKTNSITFQIEPDQHLKESNWFSKKERYGWFIRVIIIIDGKEYFRDFEVPVYK